jgi:competence protein ComK
METTNEYTITGKTMMLAPALRMEGGTVVYEEEKTFFVTQTPTEIIHENCFRGFATFDGRVKAVRKYFHFEKKVPVLVYEKNRIACFPTHSSKNHLCHWVFPTHIRVMEKDPLTTGFTLIHTRNNKMLRLPISSYVAGKQLGRTDHLLRMLFLTPPDDSSQK